MTWRGKNKERQHASSWQEGGSTSIGDIVARLGDLLDFGPLFKNFGNN